MGRLALDARPSETVPNQVTTVSKENSAGDACCYVGIERNSKLSMNYPRNFA